MDGDATGSGPFEQGVRLHREGRIEEAAGAYERLLRAEPGHVDALIHLGSLRLGQRRAGEAEALLVRATMADPGSAEAFGTLAAALQAQGRLQEASEHYQRAIALRPDLPEARFGLANCLQAMGRVDGAAAAYQSVLVSAPAHPEANYGLATLLGRLGRREDAIAAYRAALAADPDFAEASYGLGQLLAQGPPIEEEAGKEAAACFRQALDVDPDYTEARLALGAVLSRLGREEEAMAAFRAVLAADPSHAAAHNGIGILLDRKRRHAEASEHYRAALASSPDHLDTLAGLANALRNLGRHDEALPIARRAVAVAPDAARVRSLLGSILAEMGQAQEAEAAFRHAVSLAPGQPEFSYYTLQVAKARPGDAVLTALEAMLPRAASYSVEDQWLLRFALAKAYDDVGERDRGFEHLMEANRLRRSAIEYHEAVALDAMGRIAEVFSAEMMAVRAGRGEMSATPVFIVGMPRSGTTLVEQVLASHHAVFGAGERHELPSLVSRLGADRIGTVSFPERVWTMEGEDFRRIGAEYVSAIRALAPGAARVVDKMPSNFLFVGFIHLILPNARIIHVVRDPVDTCLSCYSRLFSEVQTFCYELGELGRYHRSYQRLMAHWRSVLPPDVMLEVGYEALVGDFEAEARRAVAHCGLAWDPACLEFYKSSRPVTTASMGQVRQPIYRSSVGRWRPEAALLRPLLDALETR